MPTRTELSEDVVVDASVVLRRLLHSSTRADDVLRRESLVAPATIALEVLNGLATQIRFGGLARQGAQAMFQQYRELDIDVISNDALATGTLAMADALNLSAYDASYVALAAQLGAPLATADRQLAEVYPRAELID